MALVVALASLALIALLVWLSRLPGQVQSDASIAIPASPEVVFPFLGDYRNWPQWSPWLIHEPDCPLSFDDPDSEGGSYTWDGNIIGAGRLKHLRIDPDTALDMQLEIQRPFRFRANLQFELQPAESGTQVSWRLRGDVPLFIRPLVPRLSRNLGHDLELGLGLLAGRVAPESDHPRLTFLGLQECEKTSYLGLHWEGGLDELESAMQTGFTELYRRLDQASITPAGRPFTLYRKIKRNSRWFSLDMAVPVDTKQEIDGLVSGDMPGGRFFQTELAGGYHWLGATWHSLISHMQMNKMRMDWHRPCLELYENDPDSVESPNELITTIFVPVR